MRSGDYTRAGDTKVLIAISRKLHREGLQRLIDGVVGLAATGCSGPAALSLVKEFHPDVFITEVFHREDTFDTIRQLHDVDQSIRVIGVSDSEDWKLAVRMLQSGASGVIFSKDGFDELRQAISRVLAGHIFLSCSALTKVVTACIERVSTTEVDGQLTKREREVLELIAEGKAVREIATKLFISPKTVETHRKHIMDKLSLNSSVELTKYAIKEGIVVLND